MCGIAGIYSVNGKPLSRQSVQAMGDAQAHRGPDDHRYWFWGPDHGWELHRHQIDPAQDSTPIIGFAHRRLAIVDLSGGHQPMSNEDATRWICYNGEIYNHLDLRRQLLTQGHEFATQCDTEVLIHGWEQHGPEFVQKLNGLFAYAIFDSNTRQLFLARDRFGIKPLYWTRTADGLFAFANEIKALLGIPGVSARPNPEAVAEHFTFQNTFGGKTFFQGIHLLEAGHWLLVNPDGTIIEREYWDMVHRDDDTRSERAIANELRAHFERGVDRQLMSEVPLGTFLSGGMDTGSVSAVAARFIPHMHTFTCGFAVPQNADELEQHFDESEDSRALASLLGTTHHAITLDHTAGFRALPYVAYHMDEPRLGISYQNYYTAELIRRHVTVVLSGAGGDELFAGYPWRHRSILGINDRDTFNRTYYRQWVRFMDDDARQSFFSDDFNRQIGDYNSYESFCTVADKSQAADPLSRALYFDAKTFMHGLFIVEDKLTMAHSVEGRVPLLDNDFVEFALGIPSSMKLSINGEVTTKHILKEAMREILPADTLTRRKQGFTPPDATWYRTTQRADVEALILSERALERGYFRPDAVQTMVAEHMSGQANHRFWIWSLMMFEWWNRLFLDGDVLPKFPEAASATYQTV